MWLGLQKKYFEVAILLVSFGSLIASVPINDEDKLQVLEDKLVQKINTIEVNMEKLEEDVEDRLKAIEAKVDGIASKVNPPPSQGQDSFAPTKPDNKGEILRQFNEINTKITNLTQQLNSSQGGRSPEEFNAFKASVERELEVYRSRLDNLIRQLTADKTAESELLNQQIQSLRTVVNELVHKARLEIRADMVAKIQAAFASSNLSFAKSCVDNLNNDLTAAMPEVIRVTFDNNITKFDSVVTFLRYLTSTQCQAGIISLAEAMKQNNQTDTTQFVKLAYFAKEEFGKKLSKFFPISLQGIVWTRKLCLQADAGSYLTTKQGARGSVGNDVKIVKPSGPAKSEYCKWEIIPDEDAASSSIGFHYGGNSQRYWYMVLINRQVYGQTINSLMDGLGTNKKLHWEVTTINNGGSVVIKIIGQNPLYLCNPTGRESEKKAIVSGTFSTRCQWIVDAL